MKFLLFFLMFPLLVFSQKEESEYPYQVGNIVFEENLDEKGFKPCNHPFIYQYYNMGDGLEYQGEKFEIFEQLNLLHLKDDLKNNGYVTIRFLVNCEGKTGLFRIQEMNEKYEKTKFSSKFIKSILDFTKGLKGWKQKKTNESFVDYYQ